MSAAEALTIPSEWGRITPVVRPVTESDVSRETSTAAEQRTSSKLGAVEAPLATLSSSPVAEEIYPVNPRAAVANRPASGHADGAPVLAGGAAGTVLHVQEESVLCEVLSDAGPMQVFIQRAHFPTNVRFGMPVSIAIREVNGVRSPVISERHAEPQMDALRAEMDRLVAEW